MPAQTVKATFTAFVAGLVLAGCATHQAAEPMPGMAGGMNSNHAPQMMMQALGCPHPPMDMAAMKAMTPDQHKAMMAKHAAECRETLLAEGRAEANAHVMTCMSGALTAYRSKRKPITVANLDAALIACTQSPVDQTAPAAQAPAHQH